MYIYPMSCKAFIKIVCRITSYNVCYTKLLRVEICASNNLYESFTRHRVNVHSGLLTENLNEIQNSINSGMKVLVVCNTVKNAQLVYNQINCSSKTLLHSAFNSIDRYKNEEQVQQDDNQLLVGTQAIEVSLDT